MAKIAHRSVSIQSGQLHKRYEYDIYYGSANGFYTLVPPEFNVLFDGMDSDQLKAKHLQKVFGSRYNAAMNKDVKRIITGETEADVETQFNQAVKFFLTQTIKEKKVILIFFEFEGVDGENRHWYGRKEYNKEHQKISGGLGLAYCNEVSAPGSKEPKYYLQEDTDSRRDREINERGYVKIDDTPANRKGLERIYNLLKRLYMELHKYGKSDKKIIELITNTKLLEFKNSK